jgi:hypothetical protein
MVKWSGGRGKLLGVQEIGCKYEEMAEALPGRSVGAVRGKLRRLKREKREDTYIGGGGVRAQRSRPFIF